MRYEARQYCAFRSSKCRFSSVAAASLAGCVFRVRTLPSILFRMVVLCPLHLAIFLEISGAVAFLHSLLMRLIVASDKVADAIFVSFTCVALQRLFFGCAEVEHRPSVPYARGLCPKRFGSQDLNNSKDRGI